MDEANLDDRIQLNNLDLEVGTFFNNIFVVEAGGIVSDSKLIILALKVLFFFYGLIIFWA